MKTSQLNKIEDWEVELVMALKAKKRQLKMELDELTNEVHHAEQKILNRFMQSEFIRSESYSLQAQITERRFPCWKEQFISFAGKDKADEIVAKTEPKIYKNLLINKFAA